MIDLMGLLLCRWLHKSLMYSGGQWYECKTCHRRYAVPWAANDKRPLAAGVYDRA